MDFVDPGLQTLYERALREPWCVRRVLPWDSLALAQLPPSIRVAMCGMYTDVAFAEALGVRLLERVLERAPEGPLRLFVRAQLTDELRHVHFFTEVLVQLGEPTTASDALLALQDEIVTVRDPDELMLQLQVIELSAQAVFIANSKRALKTMQRAISLPTTHSVKQLLSAVIEHVGADETRHVAFGMRYLKNKLRSAEPGVRRALTDRAERAAVLMQRAFVERADAYTQLGLPADCVPAQLARLCHQLQAVGLELGTTSRSAAYGA